MAVVILQDCVSALFSCVEDRENCLFFKIIIWDWWWNKIQVLKALLRGCKSASNTGRAEDVRFQNQAALAATTAWQFEWDPNLFSVGVNTKSLICTDLSYFGSLTDISDTSALSRIRSFVSNFSSMQEMTEDVPNQNGKRPDGHQTNVALILWMTGMNNEKQPVCLQKVENHSIGCVASIALVF